MNEHRYLTHDITGVGGLFKQSADDFVVEEIPAYQPNGEGEHLFLWIEKRDVSSDELLKRLSRQFKIRRDDIGVAGLKDRQAVTRQYVSVPARCEGHVTSWEDDGIQILSAMRHTNKLKTGHLKGNRFEIRIQPPWCDDSLSETQRRSQEIAERLHRYGLPNYYGEQRFGVDGGTLTLGLELLSGETTPKDIAPPKRKFLTRLAISAVQSDLFNRALQQRLVSNTFDQVQVGDVMRKRETGGLFVAEDIRAEQLRLDEHEIDITGPIFGTKMRSPQGDVEYHEAELLDSVGLHEDAFRRFPKLTQGTRRPYRVGVSDLEATWDNSTLNLRVTLPSGSYATVLLAEFMKS